MAVSCPLLSSFKEFDQFLYALALQSVLKPTLFVDHSRLGRSIDWYYNNWYYSNVRYVMYIDQRKKLRDYTEYRIIIANIVFKSFSEHNIIIPKAGRGTIYFSERIFKTVFRQRRLEILIDHYAHVDRTVPIIQAVRKISEELGVLVSPNILFISRYHGSTRM